MSENWLSRAEILEHFLKITEIQESISQFVEQKLCGTCDDADAEEWEARRKKAFQQYKGAIDRYKFSKKLPRDDLGIMAQATVSFLFKLQQSLGEVLLMVDMLGDETFSDIYMDSFTTISKHVREQFGVLKKLIDVRIESNEAGKDELDLIVKLERQIDEDNIVICRQISVKTGGESDFTCYMMRKIVAELEHISDYIKDCAEILADI
ncbi:MAG: hypothetical protein KGD60_08240 [Candidatus Thorarchaeota archaeon]|nr:hypothetical protein [Candidatus Thorarchaeota archaeon]